MTCREKAAIERPGNVGDKYLGGVFSCPHLYGYLSKPLYCTKDGDEEECRFCWNRELPGVKKEHEKIEEKNDFEALKDENERLKAELERYKLVVRAVETVFGRKIMENEEE